MCVKNHTLSFHGNSRGVSYGITIRILPMGNGRLLVSPGKKRRALPWPGWRNGTRKTNLFRRHIHCSATGQSGGGVGEAAHTSTRGSHVGSGSRHFTSKLDGNYPKNMYFQHSEKSVYPRSSRQTSRSCYSSSMMRSDGSAASCFILRNIHFSRDCALGFRTLKCARSPAIVPKP
jgi:hypothetical protein